MADPRPPRPGSGRANSDPSDGAFEIEEKGLSDLTGTIEKRGESENPPTSGE